MVPKKKSKKEKKPTREFRRQKSAKSRVKKKTPTPEPLPEELVIPKKYENVKGIPASLDKPDYYKLEKPLSLNERYVT